MYLVSTRVFAFIPTPAPAQLIYKQVMINSPYPPLLPGAVPPNVKPKWKSVIRRKSRHNQFDAKESSHSSNKCIVLIRVWENMYRYFINSLLVIFFCFLWRWNANERLVRERERERERERDNVCVCVYMCGMGMGKVEGVNTRHIIYW